MNMPFGTGHHPEHPFLERKATIASALAEEKPEREGVVQRRRLLRVGPALLTTTQPLGQCHEQQYQKISIKCCGDQLPTAEKLGAILLNLNKCSVNINTNSFSVG